MLLKMPAPNSINEGRWGGLKESIYLKGPAFVLEMGASSLELAGFNQAGSCRQCAFWPTVSNMVNSNIK